MKKYVYFDLETTGLSPKSCQIIQIGAICGDRCFETLVNPEETLSEKIAELTDTLDELARLWLPFYRGGVLACGGGMVPHGICHPHALQLATALGRSVRDGGPRPHGICTP